MVRRLIGLMLAGWAVHVLLRLAQLGRPAPYGSPFVEKFEWYFFHAIAYDWLWSLPFIVPFLAYYGVARRPPETSARRSVPWRVALAIQMFYLMASAADLEIMRFLSLHLSLAYVRTYLGPAAVADIPTLLVGDAGGVGLPLVLTLGAPLLVFWLGRRWGERLVTRQAPIGPILLKCVLVLSLGYGLLFHFWTGTFRLAKLRPVPSTVFRELTGGAGSVALDPQTYTADRDQAQGLWLQGRDDWVFSEPEHPFYREPLHVACGRGALTERCALDADGDGFAAKDDCRDDLPQAHPGATERPSNGVDEDCDGIDEAPWNVVLFFLESHRGLNTGHLASHGATASDTPTLDRLVSQEHGRAFGRHQVDGVPTIEGFFTAHCSLYSKGAGIAATENTTVRLQCLPEILRERGYRSRFFTAAAPDWDNQTYWLTRWYDDYDFHRERQTDLAMLEHMADWMVNHLGDEKPFFVSAITKSNHYPFNPVDDMTAEERAATPRNIGTTMRYTERALGRFFERVQGAPWFDRTVFIVTSDHGFNWGEQGYYRLMDPLIRPSTWLPLVILGDHPAIHALPQVSPWPSSHVDLAPTILDLLGIQAPNHFVGHSLVDPRTAKGAYVYAAHRHEMAWEAGHHRALLDPPGNSRRSGNQLFDARTDFHMERPLEGPEVREKIDALRPAALSLWRLTNHAFERNALFPAPQASP